MKYILLFLIFFINSCSFLQHVDVRCLKRNIEVYSGEHFSYSMGSLSEYDRCIITHPRHYKRELNYVKKGY